MTGNVVFLGFAWAGDASLSAAASLLALAAFLLGALAGGELAARSGAHRGRHLTAGSGAALVLLVAALAVAVAGRQPYAGGSRYALVVLLAIAMGLQNATARALGVPDATTTVLTLTLTGLAADSRLAAGANPRVLRRVTSVLAMLAGALVGALLVPASQPGVGPDRRRPHARWHRHYLSDPVPGHRTRRLEDARVMPRSAQPSPPAGY